MSLIDCPSIHFNLEKVDFWQACLNGHLFIAQWLWEIKPDIDISAENEHAFRYACDNGHLSVAQWLWETKPDIYISASKHAFCLDCIQAWVDNDKHTCPCCRTNMEKDVNMVKFV